MSKAITILVEMRDEQRDHADALDVDIRTMQERINVVTEQRDEARSEVIALDTAIRALGGEQKRGILRRGGTV